jgi:hypothetical protein
MGIDNAAWASPENQVFGRTKVEWNNLKEKTTGTHA